jgi:putative transcriptional regulator
MYDAPNRDELQRVLPRLRIYPDVVTRLSALLEPPPRTATALQRTRRDVGLSQDALAAAAGVSRQTISSVENRRTTPSVKLALALAAILRTTVEELFGEEAAAVSRIAPPPLPRSDPAAGAARATCSPPASCRPATG